MLENFHNIVDSKVPSSPKICSSWKLSFLNSILRWMVDEVGQDRRVETPQRKILTTPLFRWPQIRGCTRSLQLGNGRPYKTGTYICERKTGSCKWCIKWWHNRWPSVTLSIPSHPIFKLFIFPFIFGTGEHTHLNFGVLDPRQTEKRYHCWLTEQFAKYREWDKFVLLLSVQTPTSSQLHGVVTPWPLMWACLLEPITAKWAWSWAVIGWHGGVA